MSLFNLHFRLTRQPCDCKIVRHADVAQSVVQLIRNQQVVRSNRIISSKKKSQNHHGSKIFYFLESDKTKRISKEIFYVTSVLCMVII